jgi:hypothetical protein
VVPHDGHIRRSIYPGVHESHSMVLPPGGNQQHLQGDPMAHVRRLQADCSCSSHKACAHVLQAPEEPPVVLYTAKPEASNLSGRHKTASPANAASHSHQHACSPQVVTQPHQALH